MAATYKQYSAKIQEQICPTIGPLCRNMEDLVFTTKLLFNIHDRGGLTNISSFVLSKTKFKFLRIDETNKEEAGHIGK